MNLLYRFSCLAVLSALSLLAVPAEGGEKDHASAPNTPAPNTLTEAERVAGWELLFNGENFDGWRNYRGKGMSDGWTIKNGAMVRTGDGAGDIVTKDEYANFELLIEYKISPGGNSGIMFHVTEDNPAPWHSGPEIQVQDDDNAHDPQKAGWLYQLYQPGKARWKEKRSGTARADEEGRIVATRPAGKWNQLYIRITDKQCAVNMNGYPYYTFDIGSKDWDKRVAASKFAQHEGFGEAGKGHICLQDHGNKVAYRNIKVRRLGADGKPPQPIHGKINVKPVRAFTNLEFTGWKSVTDEGKVQEFRPLVITNAADGSDRLFVGEQRGVIHVFPDDPKAEKTKIFLDIEEKIANFTDRGANEEGLLGLAFHPNYEENGRFFIYYTLEDPAQTSVISEFHVSKDDPNKADPESEIELMRIKQPYANHNGGSIEFGPDGYLYIGLGDGGLAFDPYGNGQNVETLLGSILRIDVDHHADGKNYGIPEDNPFVGKPGRDEIYAYGFRNPWRICFDRKSGDLWAGDVGQVLWEEIDIVEKGGNYGWNGREGFHPFGNWSTKGAPPIPPVWEYDHMIGKSITGGYVYRGPSVPELEGYYLYADYVSGHLWALKVDPNTGEVIENLAIQGPNLQVLGYGESASGEVYFGVGTASGEGLYKFQSTDES